MFRLRLPLLATLCLAGCSLNPKGELPGATNSDTTDPSGFTGDDEGPLDGVMEPGVSPGPGNGAPPGQSPPAVTPTGSPASPSASTPPTPVGEDPGPDDAAGPHQIDGGPRPSDGGTDPFDGATETELPPDVGTVRDAGVPSDASAETDANPP